MEIFGVGLVVFIYIVRGLLGFGFERLVMGT